jgi:UV DNA damage endonuclease
LLKLERQVALEKVSQICLENAITLQKALQFCAGHHIGAFRVNSQILPVKTHPKAGYDIGELPDAQEILALFRRSGEFAQKHNLRLSFHPDQFVVLSSPNPDVVSRSVAELEYQAEVAVWIGADVINIHGGGVYGDKAEVVRRFAKHLNLLSDNARQKLTVENDDKSYTPSDLLPLCQAEEIPLVYDVHHHRCLPDGESVEEITEAAMATWNREPLFHISSPLEGWEGPKPSRHHDYIDARDFSECWKDLDITSEVEAKAKELAVLQLYHDLNLYSGPIVFQKSSSYVKSL